ncbi:HDOD domain-containing protein [Chitinimonas sp. PSY-7]|uniref:HDOD domain-containing protein n=1 Tax=Chitinimonas sp. PSY-7 TaxID=3459088 RepID=UPI00404019DF
MESHRIEVFLNEASQLPSSKNIVWELIRLLNRKDVTPVQILDILHRDQGVITRLLRLANSPFFGVSRQVGSVQDAIVVLGLMNVRRIAIAASLLDGSQENLYGYWRHSLRIASLSEVVARKAGVSAEACFLCGLLRHIGLLIFLAHDPSYNDRLVQARAEYEALILVEREKYGFDHIRLATVLVDRWHFPSQIIEAISLNYSTPPQRVSLVSLTNHMADLWVEQAIARDKEAADFVFPDWLFTSLALDLAIQPMLITELHTADEAISHLLALN